MEEIASFGGVEGELEEASLGFTGGGREGRKHQGVTGGLSKVWHKEEEELGTIMRRKAWL